MQTRSRIHASLGQVSRITVLTCLAIAVLLPSETFGHMRRPGPGSAPRYDNTFAKDFIMDAPWRVIDAATPIPLTILLKDCDTDDIRELHWIRCCDVTGGGSTILWDHDFNDEQIGDDASEDNYWTYITTVTEGHPSLPDGTLLTPAALGYQSGDAIQLEVSIYYKDTWFNYTETRYLRVHVGSGPFPWPEDWFGGDVHYHTMYTNNLAEFGAPLPAVQMTAAALGLHWLTATDHSCDLDETGDGAYSYATHAWEYTLQTPAGIQTYYCNVFDYGSSWGGLGADIAEFDGPEQRLYRGVEINLASIDGDSYEKTLHCLFYNPDYISSPLSGALGERPVTPFLPDGLDQLAAEGFAYAAHPLSDMSAEWGGIDWGVNGALWGDEDLAASLERPAFRGLQAFNTRPTRYSSDQNNPWADFDAGVQPDDPYPNELLAGITLWDELLRAYLGDPPRKIFLAGGSDAHGDFNYASFIGLDNYATDNAIGKVQTVTYVPGDYTAGDLPPMSEILSAYRAGRSMVSDGPFLEIGLDANGDGDWYDDGDLMIADEGVLGPDDSPPLGIRWASLPEFGPVVTIKLWAGNATETNLLTSFNPSDAGQGFGGESSFDFSVLGLDGPYYFRAELLTDDADTGHRAYTNPIWIRFEEAMDAATENRQSNHTVLFADGSNPFSTSTKIRYRLSSAMRASIEIFDISGRLVHQLRDPAPQTSGYHEIVWRARDASGTPLPTGVYTCRLTAGTEVHSLRLVHVN